MKTESQLFNGFIENTASKTFDSALAILNIQGNPVQLFVDELVGVDVTAIYKVKSMFVVGNILDLQVETPQGDFGMRIIENEQEELFDILITDLQTFHLINKFTLSKMQPSGLPDGA